MHAARALEIDSPPIETPRYLIDLDFDSLPTTACDILVIGGGVAGLWSALRAAKEREVLLLSKAPTDLSNSALAQGGMAAAIEPEDSPLLHLEDTLSAGRGLCDRAAVEVLTREAPSNVMELVDLGVPFDRDGASFALGLEAGHGRRRILHAQGDATGRAVTETLARHVTNHPRIRLIKDATAIDLMTSNRSCTGVSLYDQASGSYRVLRAGATILATGGACAVYRHTTNPPGAIGDGIAMAYRAGASVADMEFVQFHPTALWRRGGRAALISEAVRGEGAYLLNLHGTRFMPDIDPMAELAPRDVVARAIFEEMIKTNSDHVFLDTRHLGGDFLRRRFPNIYAGCLAEGLDLATDLIPVAPAAHYFIGGVRTRLLGETEVEGLFACGEVASTGVHGSNRLASNSLIECLVFGRRAAEAALQYVKSGAAPTATPSDQEPPRRPAGPGLETSPTCAALTSLMEQKAGITRNGTELADAARILEQDAASRAVGTSSEETVKLQNMLLVDRLIVAGASLRKESRGSHYRIDYPGEGPDWQRHIILQRGRNPRLALVSGT